MREIKFRAWQDNKMIYSPLNSNYGLQRFFGLLYEDAHIMQFTGLHDKNGKEIYEGDILSGYPHGNSIVKWDNKYGCWHSGADLIGNELKEMPEREIIGNIYENPDLCEQ